MNEELKTDAADAVIAGLEQMRLAVEVYDKAVLEGYNRGVDDTREHFKAVLAEIPSEQDVADEIDKAWREGFNIGKATERDLMNLEANNEPF